MIPVINTGFFSSAEFTALLKLFRALFCLLIIARRVQNASFLEEESQYVSFGSKILFYAVHFIRLVW